MVQLRRAGAGGYNPSWAWVGRERRPSRVAPEVPVAAGFGLIGPVIWTSREAV